jgi:hypothetical protein
MMPGAAGLVFSVSDLTTAITPAIIKTVPTIFMAYLPVLD